MSKIAASGSLETTEKMSGSGVLSPFTISISNMPTRRKSTGISDVSHFTQARQSALAGNQWSLRTSLNDGTPSEERPFSPMYKPQLSVTLPTNSKYEGTWDGVGMTGLGAYTMPHGVKFEGEMYDGCFKDTGLLCYSGGSHIRATYSKIMNENKNDPMYRLDKMTYIFKDGLQFDDANWGYCTGSDRRYQSEVEEGLQPVCKERMSPRQPPPPLPHGCFDTGDGVFNPRTWCVTDHDTGEIIRVPTPEEREWIKNNCRTTRRVGLGYRPEFYENWLKEEAVEVVEVEDESNTGTEQSLTAASLERRLYQRGIGSSEYVASEDDKPSEISSTTIGFSIERKD